jgi:predicted nucleotidyltransferase
METHQGYAPHHQRVLERFVAACQADVRVVAAFVGGSYARGTADAYSDLDLGVITTDETYEDFRTSRAAFVRLLGEPLFLEDFGSEVNIFFILAGGTEGELACGHEAGFQHMHSGPYQVLLDKRGIMADVVFPSPVPAPAEQRETMRRLVYWFWHDLSHLITALGRGQLWWAAGQLEILRLDCVNMARLGHDGSAGADGYEKVEQALPSTELAPLETTFCPLERNALWHAARRIVGFYEEHAPPLAQTHGLAYPAELARLMHDRLEAVRSARQT